MDLVYKLMMAEEIYDRWVSEDLKFNKKIPTINLYPLKDKNKYIINCKKE